MREKLRYYLLIGILFILILVMELLLPKPIRWDRTLASNDKIPYGTFVFKQSLRSSGKDLEIETNRHTFFEQTDSSEHDVLVIAPVFATDQEDVKSMLKFIESGNTVVIASSIFDGFLPDTLDFASMDVLQADFEETGNPMQQDSSFISWQGSTYFYGAEDNGRVFTDLDEAWRVHARHENGDPSVISKSIGKGKIVLVNNPWIFSNYYLLHGNTGIVNNLLSLVSSQLVWTEFYALGRGESATPLRYILSVPTLRWSYYLILGGCLVFVFFEVKRRQRPIPVSIPPKNDSLEFSNTLGNLYYESGDHKKIAVKMMAYLYEQVRSKYYMSTTDINDEFVQKLAHKSGKPYVNVNALFVLISLIESKHQIDEEELGVLNKKIEAFLKN